MITINSVQLIGNLGKDNEIKYAKSGGAVLNQSLAVRRNFKNKQTNEYETDWVNLVLFGTTAENFAKFTQKGSKVGIEGRIQSGSYDNQQGQKVYTTDVIVSNFHLIEPRQNSDNQQNNQGFNQSYQQPNQSFAQDVKPVDIQSDSLPF